MWSVTLRLLLLRRLLRTELSLSSSPLLDSEAELLSYLRPELPGEAKMIALSELSGFYLARRRKPSSCCLVESCF